MEKIKSVEISTTANKKGRFVCHKCNLNFKKVWSINNKIYCKKCYNKLLKNKGL